MTYVSHVAKKKLNPQNVKVREDQVLNTAGGYVFQIDEWQRLNRFLILGNEGGTYYATEKKLTEENFDTVKSLLAKDGKKVVDTIVTISNEGRAPKNAPAIFALAVCSVFGSNEVKNYAGQAMPKVCRYSTDLFYWVNIVNELKEGKKGKSLLRAIARWYGEKTPNALAYQICKYPGRTVDGKRWGHADLLRLARIKPNDEKKNLIFRYAIHGIATLEDIQKKKEFDKKDKKKDWKPMGIGITQSQLDELKDDKDLKYIWGHEQVKVIKEPKQIVSLIKEYNLTRESIPTELLTKDVWKALLPNMPITAMIRNLGVMTSNEVLKPLSETTKEVYSKLINQEAIKKARIHPMNVFKAWKIYQQGHGSKGDLSWEPIAKIKDGMEKAFYHSFKNCEPITKNILLGLDISGSMYGSQCIGSPEIMASEAAAIMSMVIMKNAENYDIMAFTNDFVDAKLSASMNFDAVHQRMDELARDMGSTDCALPMIYASNNKLNVDTFIVLTDNETWAGRSGHPFEALKQYRQRFNPNAKLLVVAFSATQFTIADPSDAGMLDIAGLDSAVPQIAHDFIEGKI